MRISCQRDCERTAFTNKPSRAQHEKVPADQRETEHWTWLMYIFKTARKFSLTKHNPLVSLIHWLYNFLIIAVLMLIGCAYQTNDTNNQNLVFHRGSPLFGERRWKTSYLLLVKKSANRTYNAFIYLFASLLFSSELESKWNSFMNRWSTTSIPT